MSFIEDVDRVAVDALEGAAMSGGEGVALLKFSSPASATSSASSANSAATEMKVLVDTRFTDDVLFRNTHVAVLSGGGAGHEPAHAGFVGKGMLAAAISGQVFASPGVDAIFAALRAVCGSKGAVLVVKNYTGDRLNFGLAAERARAELGLDVRVVTVADDVALKDSTNPRGVAGTLLVHKVCGFHAERGASLEEVFAAGQAASRAVKSLGVSLGTCSLPGHPRAALFGENQIEMGLGIHGEAGAERRDAIPAVDPLVREMIATLLQSFPQTPSKVAVLINNLGGVSVTEMGIICRRVIEVLGESVELVIGPGHLMTSLDMKGFSISLLDLSDSERFAFRAALTMAVAPRYWIQATAPVRKPQERLVEPDGLLHPRQFDMSDRDANVEAKLLAVCAALEAESTVAELNELDSQSGDSDCGSTFKSLAVDIRTALENGHIPTSSRHRTLSSLSSICARVGGSSGVILSIGLASAAAITAAAATPFELLRAFVEAISKHGGAVEGDRTLLDTMYPVLRALMTEGDVVVAATEGRDATAKMASAKAGRSSYVKSKVLTTPDPGAAAMVKIIQAWVQH